MTLSDSEYLQRIAEALERIAPPPRPSVNFSQNIAYIWQSETRSLRHVKLTLISVELLLGIEQTKKIFIQNMSRFLLGKPANHVLLWGARGTGKSSLVKAAFAHMSHQHNNAIIIEILREDINCLQDIVAVAAENPDYKFVIFCDDLSFETDDIHYKSLKALLDGGISGQPDNLLFCATSNRRHLMQRHMIENEQSTALVPSEAVEEKVSLSDRFGLWLGFHPISQPEYLNIVHTYVKHFAIDLDLETVRAAALEWSQTRGSRSGRVAWQFIQSIL